MKIKQSTLITLSLLNLVGINSSAFATESIKVKQIIVGPQAGDSSTNFSIKVTFINRSDNFHDWQFGFYMPRNFRQTSTSNRKLKMQVCESLTKNCRALKYQKAAFSDNDLSTVFTTIVAPETDFTLRKGKSYTISLLHNSSRGPLNYSSLPQNLFLRTPDKLVKLTTTAQSYQITNFDADAIESQTQKRIQDNWSNSAPNTETNAIIIPSPTQVTLGDPSGKFVLDKQLVIHDLSNNSAAQTALWSQALQQDLQLSPPIDQKKTSAGILLQTINYDSKLSPEAYRLQITATQIIVQASNPAGFFYALQSLRQLWFKQNSLPLLTIEDTPRFKYRGILLDAARHYFTPDQIKNFIDIMAAAKLNTLHLHLSDDEAFRLELADYPELTKIAASRGLGLPIGPLSWPQKNLSQASDKLPDAGSIYSGSYSKEQIQDLISYANLHQITIIPEIDIPGHSRALMKALPGSFHEEGDNSEYAGYGNNSIPVCEFNNNSALGQKFTADLTNILTQTAQLFNQQTTLYAINNELSIGGDEVFKGTWDDAPSCQIAPWNKMTSLQKEHYFLDALNNNPRINQLKLSGWHEFVLTHDGQINSQHSIKPNETGHVWVWGKSTEVQSKAVTLANNDYPVVLEYADYSYFDMTYTPQLKEPGFYWASKLGDSDASLSVAIAATNTQQQSRKPDNIIGLEGALWTDVIPDYTQLQYMALPKLAGLAEASWSAESVTDIGGKPNWQALSYRLGCGKEGFLAYLNSTYQANYRGYPHGIEQEAPMLCNAANSINNVK
jgi:hexosaminidase